MDSSIADGEWRGEKEVADQSRYGLKRSISENTCRRSLFAAKGFIGQRTQFHISSARDICCP